MKLQAPAILKNKYVLYVLLVLAIINVLGYVALQDYDSLALFVAVGVLSTYFSKNMAVNLLLAIAVTSLIAINKRVVEGMKNKEEDDEVEEKPKKKAKKGKKEGMKEGNSPNCTQDEDCPQGKRCNSGQCVDTFQNNVPPSSPASVDEDDDEAVGDRIDYAATMEQAYDNLQTMLGDDGIKSITSETKKLVNQQKDLMKTLNSMAPVLNTAKETLSGMDLPNIGEMGNLLKKLNGGAPDLKKLGKKPAKNDA
jgi:hypothetical protein